MEELPETLKTWLADLVHLKGVPFNYLVPDEVLLPVESIRFFHIDPNWIKAMVDGALSIGRVTQADKDLDVSLFNKDFNITLNPQLNNLVTKSGDFKFVRDVYV